MANGKVSELTVQLPVGTAFGELGEMGTLPFKEEPVLGNLRRPREPLGNKSHNFRQMESNGFTD